MRHILLGLVFLVGACASPQPGASAAKAPSPGDGATTAVPNPVADHHKHLWSADATAFVTVPLQPTIELPGALAGALQRRAALSSGADGAGAVYAPDAILLDPDGALFLQGRAEVTGRSTGRYKGLRWLPIAYRMDRATAQVTGTLAEGEGRATRHLANFLLTLRREGDGAWLISAESVAEHAERIGPRQVDASQLVRELDAAGIRRAAVLSAAYFFGSPLLPKASDERARVAAENDWVAAQVALYPNRLVGFCGLNPLADYAGVELDRCAGRPGMRGLKLHFANSGVDIRKPEHLAKVRSIFATANRLRLPVVAHVWVPGRDYGPEQSRILLTQILPAAPTVPVQIAHLAGTGPGYSSNYDAALAPIAEAIEAGAPGTANLYVDVASNVVAGQSAETRALIARRLRQIGLARVLWGSDAGSANPPADQAWEQFKALPLTPAELRTVAGNLAPYLR